MFSNKITSYLDNGPIFSLITNSHVAPVAIFRLSGIGVLEIFKTLFGLEKCLVSPRKAHYVLLKDQHQVIDDVLLLWMPGPGSFTGEDVLEVQFHGSEFLQKKLASILQQKLRQALPGEFSFRAVKNNRLSLEQAEAINHIIKAKNNRQHSAAKKLWQGTHNQELVLLRKKVKEAWIYVETNIDFIEDVDIDFHPVITQKLAEISQLLLSLSKKINQNARLNSTPQIALLGLPNVGKSTLFNQLIGEDLAIVYDQPGTTRDLLGKRLIFENEYEVEILDTAGLRASYDPIETLGINKVRQALLHVEAVLIVIDLTQPAGSQLQQIVNEPTFRVWLGEQFQNSSKVIVLFNKQDLVGEEAIAKALKEVRNLGFAPFNVKTVSGLSGEGLIQVRSFLLQKLRNYFEEVEPLQLSQNENRIFEEVQVWVNSMQRHQAPYSLELIAEDFRTLLEILEHVMKPIVNDELLESIFSQFCIGK